MGGHCRIESGGGRWRSEMKEDGGNVCRWDVGGVIGRWKWLVDL